MYWSTHPSADGQLVEAHAGLSGNRCVCSLPIVGSNPIPGISPITSQKKMVERHCSCLTRLQPYCCCECFTTASLLLHTDSSPSRADQLRFREGVGKDLPLLAATPAGHLQPNPTADLWPSDLTVRSGPQIYGPQIYGPQIYYGQSDLFPTDMFPTTGPPAAVGPSATRPFHMRHKQYPALLSNSYITTSPAINYSG